MNRAAWLMLAMAALFLPVAAAAELSSDAACAKVKIEIAQELTVERIAFDAKMVITNNMSERAITKIDVDVFIRDVSGAEAGSAFFIAAPTYRNITGVDGTGSVGAMQSAEVHWLIIPSPGAGGTDPLGQKFWVGASLKYSIDGIVETVNVSPDIITVKPEAQLVLDYFTPYKVFADNPFTPQVEEPVPFPLAVRVLNDGYGAARSLKIESAQPRIIENNQGLLAGFMLLGTSVRDSAVEPTLTVNIGDVTSKAAAVALWQMQSTLSGRFTEFDVRFTHDPGLGGELTSLIRNTTAHYYVHSVKVDLPGRDQLLDILADTDRDTAHMPDTIFESEIPGDIKDVEHSKSPVVVVEVLGTTGRPTEYSPEVELTVAQGPVGWIYAGTLDPADGLLPLLAVRRSDGVLLDRNNFWTSSELDDDFEPLHKVHILDYRKTLADPIQYFLVYEKPTVDTTPPVSTLKFNGPSVVLSDGTIFITKSTAIVMTAEDNPGGSGIAGMYRKLDGEADFVAALPFVINSAGLYEIQYFSEDRAGNTEEALFASVIVDAGAPLIESFSPSPSEFSPSAIAGVDIPRSTAFKVLASDDVVALYGRIEIFSSQSSSPLTVMEFPITSGALKEIFWDGRTGTGAVSASGSYTARLSIWDGLGNTSDSTAVVEVIDWFGATPLAASEQAQMNPSVWRREVVWQDKRSGNWDIYLSRPGGQETRITSGTGSEEMPSITDGLIVWQDNRGGDWDIYGFDLASRQEMVVYSGTGNQKQPVADGAWVAWQDDRNGNWDIYIRNVQSGETRRITFHERDQINPRLSEGLLVWEDYRHGLGEIYSYSISGAVDRRVTYDIQTQVHPVSDNGVIAWSDGRSGAREVYYESAEGAARLTYNGVNASRLAFHNGVIVYEKDADGSSDIAFVSVTSGLGGSLITAASRQERPTLGDGLVVWQDDRDGIYQIYWADLNIATPPIEYSLRRGFNLIAVGDKFSAMYPSSGSLMAMVSEIEKAVTFEVTSGIYMESSGSTDLSLRKGMGIGVYAVNGVTLEVAGGDERAEYTLMPGLNYIGMLALPVGYSAYDLMDSVGLENIQSVRRFNNMTGLWETAAVEDTQSGLRPAGHDFAVMPGEGLVITMKQRVLGWKP